MRSASLPLSVAIVAAALGLIVATAVILSVTTMAGGRASRMLVAIHVASAGILVLALAAKLAALGRRASPARARRIFAVLLAYIALALLAYALLTGALLLTDPAWSNQHLAAGFWFLVVVVSHVRRRRQRLLRLYRVRSQGGSRRADPPCPGQLRPDGPAGGLAGVDRDDLDRGPMM